MYSSLGKDIVSKACKLGAECVEVFILKGKELSIQVANSNIDNIKEAEEEGLGIRVLKNNKLGFAYTSDLGLVAIEKCINNAIDNSSKTNEDKYLNFAKPYKEYIDLDLYDANIFKKSLDEKIELAREIENYALNYDKRVKFSERSAYEDSQYEIWIANSLGLASYYQGAYCGGYALVVGEENNENQTGFGLQYSLNYEDLNPQKIGEEAGKRAIRLLSAQHINTQRASLVLEPYIGSNFLSIIAPAFLASYVQKGKSFLANKVGEKIANDKVTIIDNGAMPDKIVSAPFDGEGVPTSQTVLVQEGTLKGFLHNLYTAKKEGVKSTGNASRSAYYSSPDVGTTNFYIDKGNISSKELIKNTSKGLYITDVMGLHTANPISGDFSLGASGLWIENGEFVKPVRGVAIAGNLKDLLLNVSEVANDLTFFVGKGAPTLKIEDISISGS